MVKAVDFESVLFLLALHFNVNVPTQNASRLTPLHMCAENGNEIIMRNLVGISGFFNSLSIFKSVIIDLRFSETQVACRNSVR